MYESHYSCDEASAPSRPISRSHCSECRSARHLIKADLITRMVVTPFSSVSLTNSSRKSKLVRIAAVLITTRTSGISHFTRDLHQLYRIDYKIQLLTFNAIHNLAPLYPTDLLHCSICLRSAAMINLCSPRGLGSATSPLPYQKH